MTKIGIGIGINFRRHNKKVGTTYYVSTSGSDSNDGLTQSTPWQTLSYAESNATTPGDIIALKAGDIFLMPDILTITHSGSASNPIVWDGNLWGTVGDKAVIKANDSTGGGNVRFVTCSYVTFQNIIVDGNSTAKRGVVVGGSSDFYGSPDQYDEHDITIQDCEIKNIGSTTSGWQPGILVRCSKDTINQITIKNNYIHNIASHGIAVYADRTYSPWTGLYTAISKNIYIGYNTIRDTRIYTSSTGMGIFLTRQADGITIEHNDVVTNNGDVLLGIDPWAEGGHELSTNNIIIRYNYLENASTSGLPVIWLGDGTAVTYALSMKIYGNLIYANNTNSKGIHLDMDAGSDYTGSLVEIYNNTVISNVNSTYQNDYNGDVTLKNNIFYNTVTTGGYSYASTGTGTIIHSNNLYYVKSTGNWVKEGGTNYTQATIVSGFETTAQTTDPTFITEFTDLHLQSGSPAIGSGVAISGITTDYDGVSYGSPPAIGAYEYV